MKTNAKDMQYSPPRWETLLNRLIMALTIAMFIVGAVNSLFHAAYTLAFGILFLLWIASNMHLQQGPMFWKGLLRNLLWIALYVFILLFFSGVIAVGSIFGGLYSFIITNSSYSDLTFAAEVAILILLLSVTIFIYLKIRELISGMQMGGIARELRFDRSRLTLNNIQIGILIGFIIICMELIVGLLSTITSVSVNSNVQNTFIGAPWWFYFFAAVIEPINEELAFRGFFLPRIGIMPSAVLFGLLHYSYGSTFGIEVLAAFAFGSIAGWAFRKTGSLYPGIVAHIMINSFAALAVFGS